jgi:hypothetical protein
VDGEHPPRNSRLEREISDVLRVFADRAVE